jgi:hypothetical protein
MVVIGIISFRTCSWIVIYAKDDEKDMSDTIKRLLG